MPNPMTLDECYPVSSRQDGCVFWCEEHFNETDGLVKDLNDHNARVRAASRTVIVQNQEKMRLRKEEERKKRAAELALKNAAKKKGQKQLKHATDHRFKLYQNVLGSWPNTNGEPEWYEAQVIRRGKNGLCDLYFTLDGQTAKNVDPEGPKVKEAEANSDWAKIGHRDMAIDCMFSHMKQVPKEPGTKGNFQVKAIAPAKNYANKYVCTHVVPSGMEPDISKYYFGVTYVLKKCRKIMLQKYKKQQQQLNSKNK